MNNPCNICYDNPHVAISLVCTHIFCLLCLSADAEVCPKCGGTFENAVIENKDINYLWLYSSNFNNKWWCYNNKLNKVIETIYKDYLLIKEMNDKFSDLDLGIKIKKQGIYKTNKNKLDFTKITDEEFDSSLEVNFEDDENEMELNNSKQEQKCSAESYVVKVGNSEYRIDFNIMRQINLLDNSKTRRIERLEIPESVLEGGYFDLINFLKNDYNIIGISGVKFNKKIDKIN